MPSVCGVVTLNVTCLDFILHSIKKQTVFVGKFVTESSVKLDSQQLLSDMFNLRPFNSLILALCHLCLLCVLLRKKHFYSTEKF